MSEARGDIGANFTQTTDASMWNHFAMPLGGSQLPGSIQGSASGSPAGLQPPCLQQPRAMSGPAAIQMTSSQWGHTMPRPAEFNMVSPFQSIPPVGTPRGLEFPSSQHPSYLVNSDISHPEKVHSGFHYRALSQESKFQKLQLPSHPLNSHPVYSSVSQKELHTGFYLNQQSWAQAYGMGYSSPASLSVDAYGRTLQLRSDLGYGPGMRFSASDRSSASKLPAYYDAVGQRYNNHLYAHNVASPGQKVMESNQPVVYHMPHVDKLPSADYQRQALSSASSHLGQGHLGSEVNVVGHGSSIRSERASGLPRDENSLSQGMSLSCGSLSCARRKSCVHKESSSKSRKRSQKSKSGRGSQKNVDNHEHCAKELEPNDGRREYDHQYLSNCSTVEQPAISSSVRDDNSEDCASTSSLSSKEQGAKNNVNRDCHVEKSTNHSDLSGKQQMTVNSRSDSTTSCNEPVECGQMANNTGMRKTILDLLVAPPLSNTLAETTPTCQMNDSSVRQASSSSQDCHCARNPSGCLLHNPRRSPTGKPRELTNKTASEGNVLSAPDAHVPAVQMKDRQQEQSITTNTSDDVTRQEILDLLDKDIDVMKRTYHSTSSARQTLDNEGSQPALYAKDLQKVLELEQQSPGVVTTGNFGGGQSKDVPSLTCDGHPISDETIECFQDAVSPSAELKSASDTADVENGDIFDHTCMVCLKTFSSRDEVSQHLSVHLKRDEVGPELEDDDLAQNTRQSEQGCPTQLILETEGDSFLMVLLPAGQVACEEKVKKNIESEVCTSHQSEGGCDGQENKENSNSGVSEDQKRVLASVPGQKHTVAATHKHKTPVQLTSLSDSHVSSAFEGKRLSEKDQKGEHESCNISKLSADQNVSSSIVHKLQQCTQNAAVGFCSLDSESQPISDHVVPETLGKNSENKKLNSRSDHSHLKSTDTEQRTKPSKSCSDSSKQSVAQDCCSSKMSLTEQRTKTSEKSSSDSSRQNVEAEKGHSDKMCVDSSRSLSSEKRNSCEKKFEHRAKTKQDSSPPHSQVKGIGHAQDGRFPTVLESGHSHQHKTKDGDVKQNKSTSLSTKRESFPSDEKSVSINRNCVDCPEDGSKKRKHSDVCNGKHRKESSSKVDSELKANGEVAGSGLLRIPIAPVSHRDTTYPKEDKKSRSSSKKQKSETSEKHTSPSHCDTASKEVTKSHSHSKKRKLETPEQHTTPTAGPKEDTESHSRSKKHQMETSEQRIIPPSCCDTTRVKDDTKLDSHSKKQKLVHHTSPTSHCHGTELKQKPHSCSKKHKSEGSAQCTTPSPQCATAGRKEGTESNSHCKKCAPETSEQRTSLASNCGTATLKENPKLHSEKAKSETSEHAGLKSQIHGGTNRHSVERKGVSADNHPGMKEMKPLIKTSDSTLSVDHRKHASSTSCQRSKQTGTRQCLEGHRDRNVITSAKKCSVSSSNIAEASKTENQAQASFKLSEQHHRKSTREQVAHNVLPTQEKETCASTTTTLAEKNVEADCPPKKKHKHQEATCSTDQAKESNHADAAKSKEDIEVTIGDAISINCDRMVAKTDKAKKIVSSLRNIFKNNKDLLANVHKKVAAATSVTFEKGARTNHTENDMKGSSRPQEKKIEVAENATEHSFQESISDSRDLCKRSIESGQDCCNSAVKADVSSQTVVASGQADGKMLKTDGSSHQNVQENVSDDKNSTQKRNNIKITLCMKCMTMFANRSVYEGHGCCLNDKAKESDHADATSSEDEEVTKGHDHEIVKSDSSIACNRRTERPKNKEENCASGSRLSDISDNESQQKRKDSRSDFTAGVEVSETVRKKRKRILSYHQKKTKTKNQAKSKDRRSNCKMSVQTMFRCDVCNQSYSSQGGLLFHWQAVHKK